MNVTEIAAMPDGMPVTNFQCRIVQAYPPKNGVHPTYGAWSLMNLVVEDEQEQRVRVSWSDEKDFSVFPSNQNELIGEVVVISARLNQKRQMFGAKKETYEGAPQISVKGKHLTRSGRPTQIPGHSDPTWAGTPFDGPAPAPTPTAGNALPPKAEAPKMTTMQPKEKLTIPSVLSLAKFLAEELSASYRSCTIATKDGSVSAPIEAMVMDKTGVSVNMILMSVFKGELHATNQSIEELCGGPDPFAPKGGDGYENQISGYDPRSL